MESIRKYGKQPYKICLLHGGPGAAGEMKPVAIELSKNLGILELLQTKKTIDDQIEELREQIFTIGISPVILIGYSWGAWLAVLFTRRYPKLVNRLILVSTPPLENKYNENILEIRLQRLNASQRNEIMKLLAAIKSGYENNNNLKQLINLFSIADSYEYEPTNNDEVKIDWEIYRKVWNEASELRNSGELIDSLYSIECPVIAIHGKHDPHSIKGIEKSFTERLSNFRLIKLEQCGHIPWKEKKAKKLFYRILKEELKN